MRGRTRAGRLGLLDQWLLRDPSPTGRGWREAPGEGTSPPLLVDVGLGDDPVTTVELFVAVHPPATVIGVDVDELRVRRAQSHARPGLEFRLCRDWRLDLSRPADLIRAVNVLRGYPEAEAADATRALTAQLAGGGLLLEGSTDVDGALGCVHRWRKHGAAIGHEGLLFFTDFSRGFAPRMFRDVLPRDLRRSVKPGTEIHRFLEAWQAAFETKPEREEPPAAFARTARQLRDAGEPVRLESPQALGWNGGAEKYPAR